LRTVRGIADHRFLPGLAGAEQVADNDQACGDADLGGQRL
jgi:hypothetical protein